MATQWRNAAMAGIGSGEIQKRAVIVGGGASGVLLAAQLLNAAGSDLHVTLVERASEVGQGLAYGTTHPHFLLNVRAANMSAFANVPDHFTQWLSDHRITAGGEDPGFAFVERRLYACYLASLIEPHLARDGRHGRLEVRHGEAVTVDVTPGAAVVALSDGTRIAGDFVVLATGNETPPEQRLDAPYASPWFTSDEVGIERTAAVAIRGTGLTMIDVLLALSANGHIGPVYALSRRGRLPQVHRAAPPLHLAREDIPFEADLVPLWCWFRRLVRLNAERGVDWRACIDALRPYSWERWRQLPLESKRRFLRHARVWWDMHRHRMAADVEGRIGRLIACGQVRVLAARILAVTPDGSDLRVTFRRRGQSADEALRVDRFIDCSGVHSNPEQSENPVIRDLVAKGLARSDPLGLGLDVTNDWALIDAQGKTSERLFAIGPLTRYAGWETTAIPDIRRQCAELTARLTAAPRAAEP
jgi:uncharacterized NAD(P)/FAD-binding protein YdhS